MAFTGSGFLRGLMITFLAGVLILAALYKFAGLSSEGEDVSPAELLEQAGDALDAVRARKPADRLPASYDAVMAPLDRLLEDVRAKREGGEYDPVGDFAEVRSICEGIVRIAGDAQNQLLNETGPLKKDLRFMDQRAEAGEYLACAMWDRMTAQAGKNAPQGQATPDYPAGEVDAIKAVVDGALAADGSRKWLWCLSGAINRHRGLFPAAAEAFEKAVAIDPDFGEAWNGLGLVRIALRQFDGAEEALEKAKERTLAAAGIAKTPPGVEYATAVFNLARFHEGLASFYSRESRLDPSDENRTRLRRHVAAARSNFNEFLGREPPDSPDARMARRLMEGLPSP